MKQITIIIILFTGCLTALYGQEDTTLVRAIDNITKQLIVFPQEKIYLQTDKPYYITGENIFFRAFLLDALTNKQESSSRYVYVELISRADSVVKRVKIRPDSLNLFYGAIPLPEKLKQGVYQIRAYTRYMQNQDESSFFSKQVRIGDPQILNTNRHCENCEERSSRSNPVEIINFDVTFYPEGGQLITGQTSNVAFKALSANGSSLDITGEVIDPKGDTVAVFMPVHDGMGEFFIRPLLNEHYQAVCHYGNRTLRFDLPDARPDAVALQAIIRSYKLQIAVNKSELVSVPDLYLIIHSRGMVVYAGALDPAKEYITFDTAVFPSGVSHILLLTKDLQIVSERLVFLLNNDQAVVSFQTQKNSYKKRDHVQAQIQLKDEQQQTLVAGNFSIAVTNDKEVVADTTSSILSDILLRSELKGHIENPEYYFQKGSREVERAADLLMKTQGWTRYAIPDVIQGKFHYPGIPFERSQKFSGLVKSGLLSKPAKDAQILLMAMHYMFFDETTSDERGNYIFRNFEFPDTTKYVIQALNSKGKGGRMMELFVDEDTFPGIQAKWKEPVVKEENNDSLFLNYVEKADRQYTIEHGMRMVNLPDVVIKGARRDKPKYESMYHIDPDRSFSEKEIERVTEVKTLLYGVAGVSVSGNSIRIRGASGPPLIVIDNMPFMTSGDDEETINILNLINVADVGQVDVLKDISKTAVYGFRGANGVILIYTKRGELSSSLPLFNIKSLTPLGYQLPVEFYSPKYDTQESIDSSKPDLRTTIFWQPNVITDNEGNAKLDFYTADDPATYSVVIEGVGEDGTLIHYYGKSVIRVE